MLEEERTGRGRERASIERSRRGQRSSLLFFIT